MTVLFSVLLGISAFALAEALYLGRRFTFWLTFFLYFSGDIIFLLPLITGHGINFSLTTLENASNLWKRPRFYALIVLLSGLTLFVYWLKKKDIYSGLIMGVVLGSIIGFKVYVGLFVLCGFAILGIIYFLNKKYSAIIPILLIFVVSGILYTLVNRDAGGLVFSGFWRFEDFVVQPSLGLSHLELARRSLFEQYDVIRASLYDVLFGFLYIFFSTGTLLMGLLQTRGSLQRIPKDFITLLVGGLLCTGISGFFFLQQTGGANSSQFLISIYIVGTIFAALSVSWWLNKFPRLIALTAAIVIILLTSARTVYATYRQMERTITREGLLIPNDILQAYIYFSGTKQGSVIMVYDDTNLDCLLITIFGNRPTYTCTAGLPGVISDELLLQRYDIKNNIFFGNNLDQRLKRIDIHPTEFLTYIFQKIM